MSLVRQHPTPEPLLAPGCPDPQEQPRGWCSQPSCFPVADRGKVIGGLPDVVTIMEGKVRGGVPGRAGVLT